MNWVDRQVLRRISIYLTKLCLKIGISANQVTLIDFLMVVAAGVFFTFANPAYWLIGIVFFFLYLLIDCVDGEVARYNRAKGNEPPSPFGAGAILGGIVDWVSWPYLLACMAFGIYNTIDSVIVFIFGFLAAILRVIYMDIALMSYPVLHEKGILHKAIREVKGVRLGESKLLSYGRALFGVRGFLPVILLVIILDCFVSPFFIGSFMVNVRFIYLVIFGLAASVGVIVRIRDAFRYGARIQRI
ncbi:CDP-alcohol phosphatidyltransferase family protein [Chloroflexota bacterium]